MHGLWLGLVGISLATGCVVESDDDDDTGGEAGESGGGTSSGGSSGRGGSSTGGSATGGSATGGSATGGSSTGGTSTGGSATGGTGGDINTDPECDPDEGDLDNTPYPNCTATAGNECEECIERSCCAISRVCYGYDPGNVCGWGGPDGEGEIACYIDCIATYYEENAVYDEDGRDLCTGMCTTQMCGLVGNVTQDMVECVDMNCEPECYGIEE
ncbi:MAG TPA: hypothetical protein VFZ53_16980 [Polyangiaceae bacterium]